MLHECWIAPSRSTLPCVAVQRNGVPDSSYAPVQNDRLVLGGLAVLERGERGDELEHRARRIRRAQRLVDERLARVRLQQRLLGARQVAGHHVRIERRLATPSRARLPVFDLDDHDRRRRRRATTAFSASRCSSASIVRTRFAPGTGSITRSPWISVAAVLLVEALAARVDRVALDALLAAQVVLPRGLEAVAADELARVVALAA